MNPVNHFLNLYWVNYNVNHRFFSSLKGAKLRFDFEFPSKDRLISLMVNQEEYRNLICYGRPKKKDAVLKCTENFFEIKRLVEREIGEKI